MMTLFFRLISRGIRTLFHHPWLQALTLGAVTLVTLLAGLFLMVLYNLDLQLKTSQGQIQFQVYWEQEADMETVTRTWEDLKRLPHLTAMETFTPEQGLETLDDSLPGGANLKVLRGQSPLPPTALLAFSLPGEPEPTWAKEMLGDLGAISGVKKVHYNPVQVDLANSWFRFSRNVIWPLIVFLGLILALIVGNTIKLSMLHRREEVEILHLVGASRFYIQLPLLAGGAFQGLMGSLLALSMLKGIQLGLRDLLNFPPLHLTIRFLPPEQLLGLILALTLVGFFSSWVAVRA
ncbi:MAG: cell division protein FtsX [Desulfovibrionales bacterium]